MHLNISSLPAARWLSAIRTVFLPFLTLWAMTVAAHAEPEQLRFQSPYTPTLWVGEEIDPYFIRAAGGIEPYTFAIVDGELPHGLSMSPDGEITGTPAYATDGSAQFEVEVTDNRGDTARTNFWLSVGVKGRIIFNPPSGTVFRGPADEPFSTPIGVSSTAGEHVDAYMDVPPAGFGFNDGVLSGTPISRGTYDFIITAQDEYGNSATAMYTLKAGGPEELTVGDTDIPTATVNQNFTHVLTATGGSGNYQFFLMTGELPDGLSLGVNGTIQGTPTKAGTFDFAVRVTDRDDHLRSGNGILTIVVAKERGETPGFTFTPAAGDLPRGRIGEAYNITISATDPGGESTNLSLVEGTFPDGITFDAATGALSGIPTIAGEFHFIVKATDVVRQEATAAYTLFIDGDVDTDTAEIEAHVRSFVQNRMGLLSSTIEVPGLMERRRMASATSPVTMQYAPSEAGPKIALSTSLVQAMAAETNGQIADNLPFNIWLDAVFLAHNRDRNGDRWGNFGMVSVGGDYLVTEKLLLGLSAHFDTMTDPTDEDAEFSGQGWMAGPNASLELGKGVFWDTSFKLGGSSNDIDSGAWHGSFDTRRLMFDTTIKGRWDIGDNVVLTPSIRALYFRETVEDYAIANGNDTVAIEGYAQEQLRFSAGLQVEKTLNLANGNDLKARAGITGGFSGMDGEGAFGQVRAGASYVFGDGLFLDGDALYNYSDGGSQSVGARFGIRYAW